MTCSQRRPQLSFKEKSRCSYKADSNKDLSSVLSSPDYAPCSLKSILKTPVKSDTSSPYSDIKNANCDKQLESNDTQTDKCNDSNSKRGIRLTVSGEVTLELPGLEGRNDQVKRSSAITIKSDKVISINISGNGDSGGIHVHSQGAIDLSLGSTGNSEQDSGKITKEEETDDDSFLDKEAEYDQSTKGHRRNNSAHLMVVGPDGKKEFLTTCENDEDICVDTDKERPTNEKVKKAFEAKKIDCFEHIDIIKDETFSEITTVKTFYDETDNENGEIDCVCSKFEHLGKSKRSTKSYVNDRITLSDRIKSTYTLLLRDIRLVSLCDHLYQNDVIDMDTYQSLYEGTKHGHMTQTDGVRQLLMHLSRVSVKQKPFKKSLLESNHEYIIPLLLPT